MGRKKKGQGGQSGSAQASSGKEGQPEQNKQPQQESSGPGLSQQPSEEGGKKGGKQKQQQKIEQPPTEQPPIEQPAQVLPEQQTPREGGKKGRKQQRQAEKQEQLPTDQSQKQLSETTEQPPIEQPAQVLPEQQTPREGGKKGRKQQRQPEKQEQLPTDQSQKQLSEQQPSQEGEKIDRKQKPQQEEKHEQSPTDQPQKQQSEPQQGKKKGRKQRQQQQQQTQEEVKEKSPTTQPQKQLPEQIVSDQQRSEVQHQGAQQQKKRGNRKQKEQESSVPTTQPPATQPEQPKPSAWSGQPITEKQAWRLPQSPSQAPPTRGQPSQIQQPPQMQQPQRMPQPLQMQQPSQMQQPQHPGQQPRGWAKPGQQQQPQPPYQQAQRPAWGQPQQQMQQQPQQQMQQQPQQQMQQQTQQQRGVQREPQRQGNGRGQKQYEAPSQSEPSTPSRSPYAVTPSSSTSSLSQSRDQVGDTARTLQQISLDSPPQPAVTAGGDAPSQIVPQTTITRSGGKECRKRTTLITNYFPLNIGKLSEAIHYDVAITPDRPKKLFRAAMEKFRQKRYSNRWPAYDGNKNLYSSSPLFHNGEISDTVIVLDDDREREFTVTIKFATYVDLTCLQNYTQRFRGRHILDMDKPMQALQCIDVVLRSAPALSCIPVGRSYFTPPEQKYTLGDGCILYHGFYQAAILGWKPFVNIDVAHKAFPDSLNMIELVKEMCPRADLNRELNNYDCDSINKHVKQLKVEYVLPKNPASRRVYRVNQLEASPLRATFTDEGGRKMTVEKYFSEKKSITLRYPHLPTLWVGSRARENRILLPFELCTILPDQAVNKKMTEQQTRNMIKQAATNTATRLNNIQKSVQKADYNRSNTMREFGISVNPQPQEVEARILHPPSLQYSRKVETVYKGTWRASHFRESAKLNNWSILCLDDRTRDDALYKLGQELMQCATQFGMEISQPAPPTRLGSRNLATDLQQYFNNNKNYQMIVVVLNNRSDCYNYVKRASEIAVGCLTQCLKANTVFRLNKSTVENILLKINAKLNGLNHGLKDVPQCLRRPFMIMGADVTHPGPDSRDFPSVAAVTASFDSTAFKYSFEWRLQPSRQEMIEDLEEITRTHLLSFYRKNRNLKPEKLLYVRDGVSDGQFIQVLNVELKAIRSACQKLDRNYKPSIIFVVVQKRHHTRFFPKDNSISEDRNMNVPAGTCVDTDITHPSIVDFYLVSHASIQGVAKPTKYVKLWDDCDMSEDEIEKLMYYLCHMFARCNRSVSYPAPTYYAHLAAARARVYCEIDRIDMNNLQREQSRLTIKENISKDLPMFFV